MREFPSYAYARPFSCARIRSREGLLSSLCDTTIGGTRQRASLTCGCVLFAGSHTFGPDGQMMLPPLAAKTPYARRPIVRSSFYRRTGVFTS